jgi:hypothetical protein
LADQEIFETKIYSTSFPPRLPGNKLALRYRVKSSDLNQATTWSPVYYIDGPNATAASANALVGATATKFDLEWTDPNVSNYDLFVTYYIDIADYNARINSVGTTKTIFFLTAEASSSFIPQELENYKVGDLIDVISISSALDGSNMTVTEINTTSTPYYIRYTGDSSNTLANTNVSSGYFGIGSSVTLEQESRQYQYIATYSWTEELEKSYRFKKVPFKGSGVYNRARAIVQLEGIKKNIDPALQIAKTAIGEL